MEVLFLYLIIQRFKSPPPNFNRFILSNLERSGEKFLTRNTFYK